MTCSRSNLTMLGLTIVCLTVFSTAVPAAESVLPGTPGDYGHRYDPTTEENFSATVLEIYQVYYSPKSKQCCYVIRVERDDGEGEEIVYLGPKSRLDKENLDIQSGTEVCIIGSRVNIEDQDVIIAQQLNQQDYAVILRSKSGRHFLTETIFLPGKDELTCLVAYIGD